MFLLHNYIPCKHWLSILLDKKNSLPNMSREIKGPLRTGYPYNIDTNCFLKARLIIVKGIGSLHDLITWSTFGKHKTSKSLLKNFVSTIWKSILKIGSLRIFNRISQRQRPLKVGSICMRKTTFAVHSGALAWFSIQFLVISKFSKLSRNISLSITGLKSSF